MRARDLGQLSPEDLRAWLNALPPDAVLAQSERRRIVTLSDSPTPPRLAKIFERTARSTRPLGSIQRLARYRPADREWRALEALYQAGFAVPRPFERFRVGERDIVIIEHIPGRLLTDVLPHDGPERRQHLHHVGLSVAKLHALGFVHGDLHLGNWIVGPKEPLTLLDFQRARRTRSWRARLRDLADLDFSLQQHGGSVFERVRLRKAALAEGLQQNPKEKLRAIGRASRARAERHFRSRTRRTLRPGRLYDRVQNPKQRGMRVRDFTHNDVEIALAGHRKNLAEGRDAVLQADERACVTAVDTGSHRVIVKEVTKRGLGRAVADVFRGSPGKRAWIAGHGLLSRGIGAARPLAFLESRSLGLARNSLVVLEDVRPHCPAHEVDAARGPWLSRVLLDLVSELHRHGVLHGDFQAPHIFVDTHPGSTDPTRLIDLEGVRFRRRLSDHERIQALAQLNASLPDHLIPNDQRREAFARYQRRLPFSGSKPNSEKQKRALEEIIRRSLARRHFWTGRCTPTTGPNGLSPPSR